MKHDIKASHTSLSSILLKTHMVLITLETFWDRRKKAIALPKAFGALDFSKLKRYICSLQTIHLSSDFSRCAEAFSAIWNAGAWSRYFGGDGGARTPPCRAQLEWTGCRICRFLTGSASLTLLPHLSLTAIRRELQSSGRIDRRLKQFLFFVCVLLYCSRIGPIDWDS